MPSKSTVGVLIVVVVGGLCGGIGWGLGVRNANTPPSLPAIGTTQVTIESIWGKPVDTTSFTVEIRGDSMTIVTSKYVKKGRRIQVEYDRQLMAKTVKQLE